MQVIPAALISRDDVAPSGCASVRAIWELAGEHTGTRVGPDTLLHRVQFRYVGDAPTSSQAQSVDANRIAERLSRMDSRSHRGPWILAVLRAIDAGPHVPARVPAADLGWPTLDFKAHVRRLKALGLTISQEVGYELSDAGRRHLASLEDGTGERRA